MLTLEEIKAVQLSILKEVHVFCVENNIDYSLAHGTLLGAVRHKGFIPWDDDIDICLLEKDYERFMKAFSHPYLKALCLENDPACPYPYGKVYDSRTILYENANINYKLGVNIDVFPIYNYPENKFSSAILRTRLFFLSWIHNIKLIRLSRQRNIIKNALLILLKIVCTPISFAHINTRIREVCKRADRLPSSRIFETRSSQTVVYDYLTFAGFEEMEFEGYRFKVMKGWHDYLSRRHGNYMVLPHKDKQIPHHNIIAHFNDEN